MPQAKSKNAVGLGNSLMKDRFGKGKGADRRRTSAVTRVDHTTGESYVVNDKGEAPWVKMRSVTQQGALDEFLATAELAGTDFTAEKLSNTTIIHSDQKNPYLLSVAEEGMILGKQREHRGRLTVPRRPHWDASTTPEALEQMEKEAFLNWRRGLADLQENHDLLMTPFERNLEVWRQLWRVIERSDLVVQIVDGRNPLMFRSEDLEAYVKDVDPVKQNLLLINKADLMTFEQRREWAKYLKGANIAYKFFSASLAKEYNEAREGESDEEDVGVVPTGQASARAEPSESEPEGANDDDDAGDVGQDESEAKPENWDADTRILTVDELESILVRYASQDRGDRRLLVGLVGYPNVGKSSTINALVGAKKVSVSSTPGKTKHFQTIHLSEKVMLCDCPGLVFPNFASSKAELVCNGVLPIDQLREFTGPVALVARRIPQSFLEAVYGIHIQTRPLEEGGTGQPTSEELLSAYALHRGFMTQGQGQPDQSRAARYVLKDYVSGKLLYVEPPPTSDVDAKAFNRELYDLAHLPTKRRMALRASMETMSLQGDDAVSPLFEAAAALPEGPKSRKLDRAFFKAHAASAGHVSMPFNHKYTQQGVQMASGKQISGRKLQVMMALENGLDPKDVRVVSGKKHYKANKKGKTRVMKHEED